MTEWFLQDDAGYLAWLASHDDGFVLNTWAHIVAGDLVLHRARCRTINRDLAAGKAWTGQYGKACASTAAELVAWAHERAVGSPRPCGTCSPFVGYTPPSNHQVPAQRGGRAARAEPTDAVERYLGPPVRIVVERRDGGPDLVIEAAERLALTFFRRDPSALGPNSYDAWSVLTPRDRIVREDISAINRTMAARSPYKWWTKLMDDAGPVTWLTAVDEAWDLVDLSDGSWEAFGVTALLAAALAATIGKGRDLAVATKVLHLKRPRLIPVCDSLVLQQTGIRGGLPVGAITHLRTVGQRNSVALREIQSVLSLYGIERSLVRILDALLWTSHPASALAKDLHGWEVVHRRSAGSG